MLNLLGFGGCSRWVWGDFDSDGSRWVLLGGVVCGLRGGYAVGGCGCGWKTGRRCVQSG